MSDIQTAFRLHLLDQAAITAAVVERIYADHLPAGATKPAIVLAEISSSSEEHLLGASGMAQTRLRAKVFAATHTQATQIRDLIRTQSSQGFRGNMHGIWVSGLSVAMRGTGTDPPDDGSDNWQWYKFVDFLISHAEAA